HRRLPLPGLRQPDRPPADGQRAEGPGPAERHPEDRPCRRRGRAGLGDRRLRRRRRPAGQLPGHPRGTGGVGLMTAPVTTGAPTHDDVVLRAVDISKWYGATHALKGVNFEVRRGKVTVLFGENGAGKSTLMKILAGVEQPSGGHLELDGKRVELRSP